MRWTLTFAMINLRSQEIERNLIYLLDTKVLFTQA
jgi:hypothetical protein